jgi:putative heme transporter
MTSPSPPTDRERPSILRRVGETCLWLIVIAVVVVGAVELASRLRLVVLSTLLALVLATLLAPAVRWLLRRGWPPAVASLAVVVGFLLVFAGLGAWLGPTVGRQLGDVGAGLTAGVQTIERWLIDGPLDVSPQQVSAATDRLIQTVRENVGSLAQGALSGASLLLSILTGLVLAVVVLFFFLKDGDEMWRWVQSLFPSRHREGVREAGERAWAALAAFLRGQTVVAFFDALFIGLGLAITGVPLALPLAVITFFAAYVPYIGAVSAGAAAVLVALVSQGFVTALIVLGIILVVQQLEGNLVEPFIMGRALSVHPVAIVLGVVAGGVLAGIIGSIIATPVLAAASGIFGYLRERQAENEQATGDGDPATTISHPETEVG